MKVPQYFGFFENDMQTGQICLQNEASLANWGPIWQMSPDPMPIS
jgi:hypothetical protein